MQPALTHIALHVQDIAACQAFYQQFCQLSVQHQRADGGKPVVWLAEPGKEGEFVLVLIGGGEARAQSERDFSHLGFALDSREAVDAIASQASRAGCLLWPPCDNPYPVGYYCGLRDPQGNAVEFSYGQPLGPGAEPQ